MHKVTVNGRKFSITYDGQSIVRVCQEDDGNFDEALHLISILLCDFHRSKPGITWGCDGIGYTIEKQHGRAFRNQSGVGRIKFQQGLERLRAQYGW